MGFVLHVNKQIIFVYTAKSKFVQPSAHHQPSAHAGSTRKRSPNPSHHLSTSTTTTMPRNTRSHSNQQPATQRKTRKRGESDPNKPPKQRRTRRNNVDSEVDEAELQPEDEDPEVAKGDRKVERRAGRAKQVKKNARYVFFTCSFFFLFFFIFLSCI